MSRIHYYMTVFPTEALIASMLNPEQFGSYMATSSKRGSRERLMFIELDGEFGSDFDWDLAKKQCVPHKNGVPKHSVYLSIYRVLEHVQADMMGELYLTTSDGRSLGISKSSFPEDVNDKPYHLYQELCPVQPLVVSSLPTEAFGQYIVASGTTISVPALFYCDLKVIDLESPGFTGNIGPMYDRNLGHLNECIKAVTERGKTTKTLDRTFSGSFTYQIVKSGFGFMNRTDKVWYKMPEMDELSTRYYDWSRSAMIV